MVSNISPEFRTTGLEDSPLLRKGLRISHKIFPQNLKYTLSFDFQITRGFLSVVISLYYFCLFCFLAVLIWLPAFSLQIVISWYFTCCFLWPVSQMSWRVFVWLCASLYSWCKVCIKLRLLLQWEGLSSWLWLVNTFPFWKTDDELNIKLFFFSE